MNLATLKSSLETAIAGYFEQSYFDYMDVLNTNIEKAYPYVIWDLGNSKSATSLRESKKEMEVDVYAIQKFNQDEDDMLEVWDGLETLLQSYLDVVGAVSTISLNNEIADVEYYQKGLLSVDSEVGIRFKVKLILWC
jgi:hypothetical protein